MEQSTAQNPLTGMPHGVNPEGQLQPEYWNSLDPLYSDSQLQATPQAQQDSTAHQTPMGIDWDHPVFQQQQPLSQPPPPQQRNHVTPQTEQHHGIYSIPQSWQPNPLHNPARGYGVSAPYSQSQQQSPGPQYQPGQLTFDSRSLAPSESSFPPYSFPQNYFSHQQLPAQTSQHQRQQNPTDFPTPTGQPTLPQYAIPPGYPPDLLHNTIDLTNDFPSESGVSHHTIDPQFLNPGPQVPGQHQAMHSNPLFGAPPRFEGSESRMFNFYQNDISLQPQERANGSMQAFGS